MSPAEAGAATVTVICVAVIAAYRYLCWLLDRHIRRRTEHLRGRRDQLELDLARFKAGRLTPAAVEQQPGDPYSDDRIELERMFIPAQRQPRKDQP